MEENPNPKKRVIDISKDIQESSKPEIPKEVPEEIAEKEEHIAKAVAEIPFSEEKDELEQRKQKVKNFLSQQKDWVYYTVLGFLVLIACYIRTRNIPKLKDITTGTWTLGPDLDPFLFLRWAKYIVEHGKLMAMDTMRYVPIGYDTSAEMKLLSYMIAWFHSVFSIFSGGSVTYSAIWFPVFMFALTTIAFFLFARKVFDKETRKVKNSIALIATLFFILTPSLLPRTIAGIPEKESVAFFFIFISFYFFLEAFTSKNYKKSLIFAVLAGITTGLLALIWGGVTFVFVTIAAAVLFAFLLGQVNSKKFIVFSLWILGFVLTMIPFSARYTFQSLISSTSTAIVFMVFFILLVDFTLFKERILRIHQKIKIRVPRQLKSLVIAIILALVFATLIFGTSFISNQIKNVIGKVVNPIDVGRFSVTVAENRQPYFIGEWKQYFGPIFLSIPLYFWLFFTGSIALFSSLISKLSKKERIILTISYLIFLICLIFSRYSPNSKFNGTSGLSLFVYFGGWIFFLGFFARYYLKRYSENRFDIFKEFNFSYILYFIILTLSIVAARGAVRLVMVLGAVSPVAVSFLAVKTVLKWKNEKTETTKLFFGIFAVLIILSLIFTAWNYYQQDKYSGENFAPGMYQQQWQKAMAWIRENTSQDSVFAHWWDYGYWLQSIGERATILDGGNAVAYWNHLMGRYVLTEPDEIKSLEFLYTHNTTHLLIDSSEIGKYTAYSSIGSDENYDRFSWISSFFMDESQTQETNNETYHVYSGGFMLDEDVVWEQDGKKILLPRKNAGIGAIILRINSALEIAQPEAIFSYAGQQYKIPLKYAYYEGELHEFESGLDSGVFIFPLIKNQGGSVNVNRMGSLFYLSSRTLNSRLVRLYLFNEESNYFKLVHSETNLFIENMKQQGLEIGEFAQYQGFQGPIKIWEVSYPESIEANPDYLKNNYPKELSRADLGEYSN